MQQRAGLLFLAKNTRRILLILEDSKWTVPTFQRTGPLLEDAQELLKRYSGIENLTDTTSNIIPTIINKV